MGNSRWAKTSMNNQSYQPVIKTLGNPSPDKDDLILADVWSLRGVESDETDIIRQEAAASIMSVFTRLGRKRRLQIDEIQSAVQIMMHSLLQDQKVLSSLTSIKDADYYTYTHSVNVSILAMCLAIQIGFDTDLENLGVGGLIHDIGKIETPIEILHKSGPLDSGEAHIIKQHPATGMRMLISIGGFNPVSIICARDHHESMNGKGYPLAKSGDMISPYARIVSVTDVYDALTTDRPYRAALPPKQAISLMSQSFQDSFDTILLNAFISLAGYYPVGSTIRLSNGFEALVMLTDPMDATQPTLVKTVLYPDGLAVADPQLIDLRENIHLFDQRSIDDEEIIEDIDPRIMREIADIDAAA
jgi:putative nucleotidyltransferase with HDIG domain